MSLTSITVLSLMVWSFSSRFLMMLRAVSTGTEVNRADSIIGTETFPRCQGHVSGLFNKILGAANMVWGLANQGFKDFVKFLSHTIGDRSTARYYRP